jgi:hypothetical protein
LSIVIRDRTVLADLKRVASAQKVGVAVLVDMLAARETARVTGESYGQLLARVRRDYQRRLRDPDVSSAEKISVRKTLNQIRHAVS